MKVRADILVTLNVNIALWVVTPCSLTGTVVQEESTASTVYSKVETTYFKFMVPCIVIQC